MKNAWIPGLAVVGLLLFLVVPASSGVTVQFDDLIDRLVTTVVPATGGTVTDLTNEDSDVLWPTRSQRIRLLQCERSH